MVHIKGVKFAMANFHDVRLERDAPDMSVRRQGPERHGPTFLAVRRVNFHTAGVIVRVGLAGDLK